MNREIILEGGPVGLKTATLTKHPGGVWPDQFGLFRDGVKLIYRRRTNSRFVYAGTEPVPATEPVVEVIRDDKGWTYLDPTGKNSYDDLPKPPPGMVDTDPFFRELFAGGLTHWKLIDNREGRDGEEPTSVAQDARRPWGASLASRIEDVR